MDELDGSVDRASATSSDRPKPSSSTSTGSHAITITRPGHAPIDLMNRSTVCGSMPWGLIVEPSSIAPSTDCSSGSITYSVPGSPPWRLTSRMISAS